jgi:uncharacterized protein YndB with AHSA1/START domain
MTARLDVADDRSTLRFDRFIPHGRERVWRAVTDPAELARWFPGAVVYEPRVGAPMQFDFGGEHGLDPWPGEVLEWDPPRVFAFAWNEDILRFELDEADAGTELVFTHSFAHQPGKAARDASGWSACFEAFDALLDGRPLASAEDAWRDHKDEYTAAFGALSVEGPDGSLSLSLMGPYLEVDGRPAVAIGLDDGGGGVLVVRDADQALEDGAAVEIRAGSVDEPGEVLTTGTLRDPLAGARTTLAPSG